MSTHSIKEPSIYTDPQLALVCHWIFRCLVELRLDRKFLKKDGFSDEHIAEFLAVYAEFDEDNQFNRRAKRKNVRTRLIDCEQDRCINPSDSRATGALAKNRNVLKGLLNLSDIDCRLLELAALLRDNHALAFITDYLKDISTREAIIVIATILSKPPKLIRQALSAKGVLAQSGLLTLGGKNRCCRLSEHLQFPANDYSAKLFKRTKDPTDLLPARTRKIS